MKKIALLVLLVIFAGLNTQAQQLKIGYTNFDQILLELPEVQAIEEVIDLLLVEKDSLLAIRASFYQSKIDNLENQNLTQSELNIQVDSISTAFETERQASINEVQQKEATLLSNVERKVYTAIEAVGDSLKLDFVFNRGSINEGAFIFYTSEEQIDITEMVKNKIKTL